jgi:hypothetical protein
MYVKLHVCTMCVHYYVCMNVHVHTCIIYDKAFGEKLYITVTVSTQVEMITIVSSLKSWTKVFTGTYTPVLFHMPVLF